MTESEAWDSLAEHLKQKNHTGVLVLADWFQENGKEEVAVYLRWATKKDKLPLWMEGRLWLFTSISDYTGIWRNPEFFAITLTKEASELQEWRRWVND